VLISKQFGRQFVVSEPCTYTNRNTLAYIGFRNGRGHHSTPLQSLTYPLHPFLIPSLQHGSPLIPLGDRGSTVSWHSRSEQSQAVKVSLEHCKMKRTHPFPCLQPLPYPPNPARGQREYCNFHGRSGKARPSVILMHTKNTHFKVHKTRKFTAECDSENILITGQCLMKLWNLVVYFFLVTPYADLSLNEA